MLCTYFPLNLYQSKASHTHILPWPKVSFPNWTPTELLSFLFQFLFESHLLLTYIWPYSTRLPASWRQGLDSIHLYTFQCTLHSLRYIVYSVKFKKKFLNVQIKKILKKFWLLYSKLISIQQTMTQHEEGMIYQYILRKWISK